MRQCNVIERSPDVNYSQTEQQKNNGLRRLVLSDFAGKKAQELMESRHSIYADKMFTYFGAIKELTHARRDAIAKAKHAFASLNYIKAIKEWIRSVWLKIKILCANKRAPVMQSASIEELQAKAGSDAEKSLDAYLMSCLDARWTLISGYHGYGGEIDRILVGTKGIYAFEVKGNGGVINSDGTYWWSENPNRSNTRKYKNPLHRAPDVQLNKAVRWLSGWLKRNKIDLQITRIAVFAAPEVRIGRILHADVDDVVTLRDLEIDQIFQRFGGCCILTPEACNHIVRLIIKDHKYCERKRWRK